MGFMINPQAIENHSELTEILRNVYFHRDRIDHREKFIIPFLNALLYYCDLRDITPERETVASEMGFPKISRLQHSLCFQFPVISLYITA